ncbi:phosphotransferase family protein [Paenibacillus sophorae]|nr:phosphotransferase [Paenibacillus sophorae]QWU14700.1 phosphotransferase [Paenibacillus sophorae]
MAKSGKDTKFEQVVHRIDTEGELLGIREMEGGVSAQVTALEILLSDGQVATMIIRQHGEADLRRNPQIAADEYKLLQLLKSEGLLVPAPYFLDLSCEIFQKPYLVMEFMEGKTDFNPSNLNQYLSQLSTHLTYIHSVDCSKLQLDFLPKQEEIITEMLDIPVKMDKSLNEGLIRDMLKSVWPLPRTNKDVILHGDYWPGNILWKDGRLASMIDWEDAAIGDPLADLANSRLEVLFHFGLEAMNAFTGQYQSMMTNIDFTNLPYWDLCAALRLSKFPDWGLDQVTEDSMYEKHRWFVTQTLHAIGI